MTAEDAEALASLFAAAAESDARLADEAFGAACGGDDWAATPMPVTVAVLASGPAEAGPLEPEVRQALAKALEALGYDPDDVRALCSRPGGNGPDDGGDDASRASARASRVRTLLEAADPDVVVGLDSAAAEDLAAAFGLSPLEPGVPVLHHGRRLLSVDDFAPSLGDDARKRRVWGQLRAVKREPDGRGTPRRDVPSADPM